jgi:hypothetical protein
MIKFAIALTVGAVLCSAGPITYDVSETVGAGSVTGTIETDGNTGVLAQGDISAFNLLVNNGSGTFDLTNLNAAPTVNGSDLTATATQLSFNFGAGDEGYVLFEANNTPFQYFCLETAQICSFNFTGSGIDLALSDTDATTEQFASVTGTPVVANVAEITTDAPPPPADGLSVAPEPSTISFLGLGFAALGFWKYRAARAK